MPKWEPEKIRLGVSACLLGESVRYDGGHKRDAFLVDTLGPFVEWVPVCPEVEMVSACRARRFAWSARRPIRGWSWKRQARTSRRGCSRRVAALRELGLHGYVLKRSSPSCGLLRVRVYADNGQPGQVGRGLFAAALTTAMPTLPVEEEGQLCDAGLRENFIERVFAAARWRAFSDARPCARDLIAFHAAHKFAILAHVPRAYSGLGRLVAAAGPRLGADTVEAYGAGLMAALAAPATRARHVNVLEHLAGFFKRQLTGDERAELAEVITEYRRGLVPLVVPLTLIKHHVRRFNVSYLSEQVYLTPHPRELMLRNHV
jgi:uncharacterized protein YbgA (DUF1722 family)/uncharacterized protein YbbK (DUF523 family)